MNNPHATYEFGDFALDVGRQTLTRREGGEAITLSGKAFDTLVYLVEHAGEALDKDTLLTAIWPGVIVEENSLTQTISTLRQMLGEARGENRYIITLPRKGYRFVAAVTLRDNSPTQDSPTQDSPTQDWPTSSGKPIATPRRSHSSRYKRIGVAAVGVLMIGVIAVLALYKRDGRSTSVPPKTLAILPFKPLVAAERDESLELGMADSLISSLSQSGDQTVRPLSSVRRFTAVDQDAIGAGRELDADVVLDGSIQRQGDRLRVSVRLLRVSDGRQLWTKNFDQKFTDIFAVQDAIAVRVAMELPQWKKAGALESRRYTTHPGAYASYASGRFLWSRYSEPGMRQAIAYFEKAIELDPNYALAYVGLADSYATMGVFEMRRPDEVWPLARKAVDKALSIDPELPAAHATLGHIYVQYEHRFDDGEREYDRAVELDPNYASAYFQRGMLYGIRGEGEKGIEQLAHAIELEPYWIGPRAATGQLLIGLGRYDEAIELLRRTLALDESADNTRGFLIRALIAKGDYEAALAEIPARHLYVPLGYSLKAQALALSSRRDEAVADLNRLLELSKHQFIQAMNIAAIYAALGDADNAFLWLDRAMEDRSTHLPQLATTPVFASLRGDPRFTRLVDRIGMNRRKAE